MALISEVGLKKDASFATRTRDEVEDLVWQLCSQSMVDDAVLDLDWEIVERKRCGHDGRPGR